MKLYYTKRSPYARKARIIAIEKNINLELVEEDLTKKSQDLFKVNPLAKIPALVLDNGDVIYDSPVICEYLDSLNDKLKFIPAKEKDRLNVLQWQALSDGIMDVCVALYMEKMRHPNDLNQPFIQAQEETLKRSLTYLNDHVDELKSFSLASISVISAFGYVQFRAPHVIDKGKYKRLISWSEEFSKRSSVATTIPTS